MHILIIITITTTDCVLQGGIGGITGNSTLVVLVSNHHDVAIHTPVGSPAVFVCVYVFMHAICMCMYGDTNIKYTSRSPTDESGGSTHLFFTSQ